MHKEHNEEALIEEMTRLICLIKKRSIDNYEDRDIYLVINDIFDLNGMGTPFERLLHVIDIQEEDEPEVVALQTISEEFNLLEEKKRIGIMIKAVELSQ